MHIYIIRIYIVVSFSLPPHPSPSHGLLRVCWKTLDGFDPGFNRPVTSKNLGEYRARLVQLRAPEYIPQASAFRVGLEAALPRRVLSMLTWREMKELVCGRPSHGASSE